MAAAPWTRPPGPFEDLGVARANARQPHVPLRSFATRDEALAWSTLLPPRRREPGEAEPEAASSPSARVQRLDGRWEARFLPSPEAAPEAARAAFGGPGAGEASSWFPIDVPGCWQRQSEAQGGLRAALEVLREGAEAATPAAASSLPDPPQYLNFRYPIPVDPPTVPETNPTALYRRTFPTPTAESLGIDPDRSGRREAEAFWRGRGAGGPTLPPFRTFLRIGAADVGARVWLNGAEIGWAADARLPAEWEVTGLLVAAGGGENALAVAVPKYAASTYLEDQDTWRLTGILRSVDLIHKPWASISNVRVRTPLAFGEHEAWGGARPGRAREAEESRDAALERGVERASTPPSSLGGEPKGGEAGAPSPPSSAGPAPSDGVPLGSYLCRFQPLVSASLVVDIDLELPPAAVAAADPSHGRPSRIPTPVGTGGGLEAGDRAACGRVRVVAELWRQDRAALAGAHARGLAASEVLDRAFSASGGDRRPAWSGEAVPEPLWRARDGGGGAARAGRLVRGARATVELADAAAALWPGEEADPPLWSAEAPHLWTLVVRLEYRADCKGGAGAERGATAGAADPRASSWTAVEHEAAQVGFRQTWIRDGTLVHNGRPLILRGANRHEFDPVAGRPPRPGLLRLDLSLLRRLSFNAVRLSHYPNDDAVYEACSAFGLFVVDEADVETHGFDPGLKGASLDPADAPGAALEVARRVQAMQERDLNHPCIVLWSLGNESGLGAGHLAAAGYLRFRDPSRPVHYEGGGSRSAATDVVCPMYARVRQLQWLADLEWKGVEWRKGRDGGAESRPDAAEACDAAGRVRAGDGDGGSTRAAVVDNNGVSTCAPDGALSPPLAGPFGVLARPPSTAPPSGTSTALAPYPHPFPRPVVLCEYSHSMGNSGGDMALYWDAFRADSRLCGGFVWDWADEAFLAGPKGSFGDPLAPGAPERVLAAADAIGGREWASAAFRKEARSDGSAARDATLPCHDPSPLHSAPLFLIGGDFGDDPHDAQFCCNGVVGADRLVHPSGIELSASQFPVEVRRDAEGEAGEVGSDGGSTQVPLLLEIADAFLSPSSPSLRAVARLRLDGSPASGWQELAPPRARPSSSPWRLSGFARHARREARGVPAPGPFERPVRVERRFARVPAAERVLRDPARLATLDVLFVSTRDELWGPAGTPLKRVQVPLWGEMGEAGDAPSVPAPPSSSVPRSLPSTDALVVSTASGVAFSIDPRTGLVTSIRLPDATELLASPLVPCLYRAPTDNDRGGSGGSSHAARWAAAGLDRLTVTSASVHRSGAWVLADLVLAPTLDGSGSLGAQVEGVGVGELGGTHWLADGGAAGEVGEEKSEGEGAGGWGGASVATKPSASARVRVRLEYAAAPSGGLRVRAVFDAREALPGGDHHGSPGTLPRVGLRFAALAGSGGKPDPEKGAFGSSWAPLEWLGLGPHETYPDRLRSGQLARHAAPRGAVDAHVPYVYPGENGGRSQVCWLALRNGPAALAAVAIPYVDEVTAVDPCDGPPADGEAALSAAPAVSADSEAFAALPADAPRFPQVSFSPFSLEELARATHDAQLPEVGGSARRPATHVHLDAAHAGVGGDDSWSPAILPRYLVRPGVFRMALDLLAWQGTDEAPGDRAHGAWSKAAEDGNDEGARWWR